MPATITDTVLKEMTGYARSDAALAIDKARAISLIKQYIGDTKYDGTTYNDRINGALVDLVKVFVAFEGADSVGVGDISQSINYKNQIGAVLQQLGATRIFAPQDS